MKKFSYLIVLNIIFVVILTSCISVLEKDKEFTVTFNSNGGSTVQPQIVREYEKIIKPEPPTRNGYTFMEWYKEAEFTNVWIFENDVATTNLTLHAKWEKNLETLIQEEHEYIVRYISINNLVVLTEYPQNSVFKEKEYYRTSDGLFFHVVDSGNGTRVQLLNDVSVRYDYCQYVKDAESGDTTRHVFPSGLPYSFVYGISQTYSSTVSPVCPAWVIPLSYVGENAVVDMIIPSSLGSYNDNMNVMPMFYKNLRYTRFN